MPRQSPTGPARSRGGRQWHDHRYRQALAHPRRRPPCPPAPPPLPARGVSPPGPPRSPTSITRRLSRGRPATQARRAPLRSRPSRPQQAQQARPAPRPVKLAAPKPTGKPGLELTCEPDANARPVGDIISSTRTAATSARTASSTRATRGSRTSFAPRATCPCCLYRRRSPSTPISSSSRCARGTGGTIAPAGAA
jgi:hypothetical protein